MELSFTTILASTILALFAYEITYVKCNIMEQNISDQLIIQEQIGEGKKKWILDIFINIIHYSVIKLCKLIKFAIFEKVN